MMTLWSLGVKNSWDEWVGTERLMTLTEANLEKQRKLFKSHNGEKNKGRVSQAKKNALTGESASIVARYLNMGASRLVSLVEHLDLTL